MKQEKVASVYARTLWETANAQGVLGAVSDDMRSLSEAFGKLPDLQKQMANPITGADRKAALLQSVSAHLCPLTGKFLRLLETKNRLRALRDISGEYLALEESRRNVSRALVTSAVPLSQAQLDLLTGNLEAKYSGKKFILSNRIDPSLLAGFRIQVGDIITDASIRNKLDLLRQKLAA
jgi:F-type H+-transporting ATPase subunit delta